MTSLDHGQVAATARWAVVVPVKRLAVAKSRLDVLGDDGRRALALAFAEDVVLAARACAPVVRVLVVTDDGDAAVRLAGAGAEVAPDLPDAGLNAALQHGADLLRADQHELGVAAVSADLPALRPADLAQVLRGTSRRAVVADAAGTGTTVLAAAPGSPLDPAFGGQSLTRHVLSGAERLPGTPGIRRDVDTPEDLRDALRLGVGPRTTAVAEELGLRSTAAVGGRSPRRGTMHP